MSLESPLSSALIGSRRFFTKAEVSDDLRTVHKSGGREGDVFYRERWSHDKVVRSTHGVNCTGSCSWKVYVKDGIITWEAQQTDYPSAGADRPEYEPRGCPRGAAFSWYTYSPTRVRYPYVRGVLLEMFRAAKRQYGDPVVAWGSIVQDPEKARAYKSARGKGGLVRASWDEVAEIVAAAHVYTVKRWGPDRIAGFSPIPAMSPVSYASGSRFLELIGAPMLSFYDWYADLPNASPQMFGDQTDVPESGDWWDAGYLMMWGSNVPMTRTPDAHWMTEARYRGQKVIAVAPDYAENVKFADEWVTPAPGTDGALAMAMGHVVLKEFFVDTTTPFFADYTKQYTDLPHLVCLEASADGTYRPGKFLVEGDLGGSSENAMWKPAVIDATTGEVRIPHGSIGDRYGDEGLGKWNLELGDIDPALTMYLDHEGGTRESVEVELPRFDAADGKVAFERRGVPVARVGDRLVTTVLDLLLAQYGVARPGLPGAWPRVDEADPHGYDDPAIPATPAWQEQHTGVPARQVTRLAREWAQNAIDTEGRGMILLGAGVNHWFHSDQIYRAILLLTTITGTQGRNGGGWAHYVGQEKIRPIMGFQHMAFALDWHRPPRHMNQTAYWYVNTSQYRYDTFSADDLDAGTGVFAGKSVMDLLAQSVRLGWSPSYPTFDRSSLQLADDADAAGMDAPAYVAQQLKEGALRFAVEDPEHEDNHPRILSLWRSNLLGSSAKGNEYFLRHLLGTDSAATAVEAPPDKRPRDVEWPDKAAEGRLDLLTTIDFRMTSSTIFSDVVLPAATWYEKHDLSTTDMHPFVHSFNPAISPPWETKSDWDTWKVIARRFSELAVDHLGTRKDVVAKPLWHDTPEAMATEHGVVKDWKTGEVDPIPGKTMPVIAVAERDYTAIYEKMTSIGPLMERVGMLTKGVSYDVKREIDILRTRNGVARGGAGDGQPKVETDVQMADAILHLAGVSNGHLATQGFRFLEKRTGTELADLAAEHEGKQITFADTQVSPVPVITSPEWSGSESGGRRYSPFTINIERKKPFHTLTGRQQFYVDHDWFIGMGEMLPVYRPPLNMTELFGEAPIGEQNELGVSVRYLTPHNKWSIHSEYQDNLFMLSLSRGGQSVWVSDRDAAKIGILDNDWIEMVNRNGVVAARAIVSHRMPEGTVYMHHAQDRLIDVPLTERDGKRGGIHNSLTRILLKPNHIVGGYAQLAYFFNYIGPIGNNRDEVTMIRKRTAKVEY
ncbi:nitrate reductase subunit alpha [Nocardioides ganghwensis]|uniref:nitrate reductase (quinone) n=1 Tax=Nocardioides ganghwensis TaxID=252230 RepID=A0A4Q2SJS4_9ACTN|nr:nitrate reductase subunit alpha [Nocardioides ganghwensis]MBD3944502.1 nitrate reductase subunit alpha [Nocardioides ganghwensis]RYC04264.1 nitrate reductase subunit alpha [Nocardioides ganghwensis]